MRKLTEQDKQNILAQGKRQFMAGGYENSQGTPQCPYKSDGTHLGDAIIKLWLRGYTEARFIWQRSEKKPFSRKPFVKRARISKT